MIKIRRERYVIVRKSDGYILCRLDKMYDFKDPDNIGNTAIKTYVSETVAKSGLYKSFHVSSEIFDNDYELKKVIETIEEV